MIWLSFLYTEGVQLHSPGSRSAPWVMINNNPYAEGVTQHVPAGITPSA